MTEPAAPRSGAPQQLQVPAAAPALGLSPAETAFVDALIEVGDTAAAAAIAGTQPSVALDPRIQSAIVERIRQHGPSDAAHARRVLRDLAERAENEGVRYRAATTLWERGLGKVPDTLQVDVSIQHVSRAALWAEIRALIDEVGLPPAIEGDFEEVAAASGGREADALFQPEVSEVAPAAARSGAPQQQTVEAPSAGAHGGGRDRAPSAGSSPATGASSPRAPRGRRPSGDHYVPPLPLKWRQWL